MPNSQRSAKSEAITHAGWACGIALYESYISPPPHLTPPPTSHPPPSYNRPYARSGHKLHSGTSSSKAVDGGLVRVALFWKSHCALVAFLRFCTTGPDRAKGLLCPRDYDLRESIPHTWASSHDNLFQSNFSAWSSREAILGTTPDWPI